MTRIDRSMPSAHELDCVPRADVFFDGGHKTLKSFTGVYQS